MINKIIDAVSVGLDAAFADFTIHTESIEQGFEEPCFFILPLNAMQKQLLGSRYKREYPLDIHYFPAPGPDENRELRQMGEDLLQVLEYITVDGDLVRGLDLHFEQVDGVLHFFANYKMHVHKEIAPEVHMDDLTVTNGLKE